MGPSLVADVLRFLVDVPHDGLNLQSLIGLQKGWGASCLLTVSIINHGIQFGKGEHIDGFGIEVFAKLLQVVPFSDVAEEVILS